MAGGFRIAFFVFAVFILSGFTANDQPKSSSIHFPWAEAGLTEQQAAAHLLSRFTWGPYSEEIEDVTKTGLENWFAQQLDGIQSDELVARRLKGFEALTLSNAGIVATYLKGGQVLRLAIADGAINKDSVSKATKPQYRALLRDYMQKKGYRSERELVRQLISQKIIRAIYSQNQLHDVMTDFWFNHFNVSLTKNACSQFVPNYERDVIRPRVTGKFEDLLVATAKSPAMLLYLDNFSSAGTPRNVPRGRTRVVRQKKPMAKGLNENYAREVMELHTLGVDGGYTQRDVTEAARILTGWTITPMGKQTYAGGFQKLREKIGDDKLRARGFVQEGDFLFTPNRHDSGPKVFLGEQFNSGGGYNEGLRLLHMLASNPSTAHFISMKIATRFVSDTPPETLVDKMAATWSRSGGDIRQVLITMVTSGEFWNSAALREKTKSPFELAISTARALHADIELPYQLFTWINRMGQQLYSYQAPTGFPDKGQYWINTGSLLNRMNFGLAFADGRIAGVKFDLLALNLGHEPESADNALEVYSQLMMPERNTDRTIRQLTPLLNDPDLQKKVGVAAGKNSNQEMNAAFAMKTDSLIDDAEVTDKIPAGAEKYRLSQVVGILIGSPEFQRR